METYIMSDIHGASKKFYKMLKQLKMDLSRDVLIIDGDILDRGEGSLKLFFEILDMQKQYGKEHVKIIKGNHELFLQMYIDGRLPVSVYSSKAYGGADVIKDLEGMSASEKEELRDIINNLPLYETVFSEKRNEEIVVSHTGPHPDYIVKNDDGTINVISSLELGFQWSDFDFLINSFIQKEAPFGVIKSLDKVLCVGHKPTIFIPDISQPIIAALKGNRVILIDCGAGHPKYKGRLGCLRIDDETVFYV